MKTAFFCNIAVNVERVYGAGRRERIALITDLMEALINDDNFDEYTDELKDVEVIFSTWGMPALSDDQLNCMPKLRAVMYAAGSVKGFAEPFFRRGITIVGGWGVNAYPVAEFTVSQILLSGKGYFRNIRGFKIPDTYSSWRNPPPKGNFGESVALLGAGMVGRQVIEMLKPHTLKVLMYDPSLMDEAAAAMGVEKVSLQDAFARAYVVSNHMPELPETRGILDEKLFSLMRPGATLINCGRGSAIKEADLIKVFSNRQDLTALLDVSNPEPPEENSPLYTLPNIYLTSHIAGAVGDELMRMSDCMISQCLALMNGQPLQFVIAPEKLKTMA